MLKPRVYSIRTTYGTRVYTGNVEVCTDEGEHIYIIPSNILRVTRYDAIKDAKTIIKEYEYEYSLI